MKRTAAWLAAGLLGSAATAAGAASPAPPRVPYVTRDVCPFEGCRFGTWIARAPLHAYRTEGDTSVPAFTVPAGDRVEALRGNLHVIKLGEVRVTRPVEVAPGRVLERGDRFFILAYRGQGTFDAWQDGRVFPVVAFWVPFVSADEHAAVARTWPEMLWWVLIKARGGRQGWLRLRNVSRAGFEFREGLCIRDC